MNYRKTRAEISTKAFKKNLAWLKPYIGEGQLMAIVKADGYGHGVAAVTAAVAAEVDGFGVGFTDEAIALRAVNADKQKPVLILEGCQTPQELQLAAANNFSVVVHSVNQLQQLEQVALKQPLNVWLKVDTGMHRLGLPLAEIADYLLRLKQTKNVASTVIMSHLANADNGNPLNHYQWQQFGQLKRDNPQLMYSLHNSAALLNPQFSDGLSNHDWVRTGLLMYGINPSSVTEVQQHLVPAMSLKAPVIATHDLNPGDAVGYGSAWIAKKPTRIATVAIGYADGYPRQCSNGTPTGVCGKVAPLVGRVSMDMITIDVTDIPEATVGDDVELWGQQIDVREVAACADTIAWHLLTGTSIRVPRIIID